VRVPCLFGRHRYKPGAWMQQIVWFGGEPQRYGDSERPTGVSFDVCLHCGAVKTRMVHT
jgi:hypothetical protein